MKQHFIIEKKQKHLILFFAGWGMDEKPFLQFQPKDTDWMICYDYRSLIFDYNLIKEYSEITLIAWSMGVWAASQTLRKYPQLPIRNSIAMNGTMHPVHDTKGISIPVFEGTFNGLNEQSLQKFQKRMCGSAAALQEFLSVTPQRPVTELKEELACIRKQYDSLPPSDSHWKKAIIGKNDRIFLSEHQENAWKENAVSIELVDAAHYQKEWFEKILTNFK